MEEKLAPATKWLIPTLPVGIVGDVIDSAVVVPVPEGAKVEIAGAALLVPLTA